MSCSRRAAVYWRGTSTTFSRHSSRAGERLAHTVPSFRALCNALLHSLTAAFAAVRCVRKLFKTGEPYASLSANLTKDYPKYTRREITAATGQGLTLMDVVEVQKSLGGCACQGRKSAGATVE